MKCAVLGHFSRTFFKKKTKHFISCYFSCNLYTSLITMTDLCKVPYFEELESQEYLLAKEENHLSKNEGGIMPSWGCRFGHDGFKCQ